MVTILNAVFVALVIIVGAIYIGNLQHKLDNAEEKLQEEQIQNEELKKSNKRLTEGRDELYSDYKVIRDELWNLKNNVE